MKHLLVLAIVLLAGCTSIPPSPTLPVDATTCTAVEGAPAKQTRDGRIAYRYNCGGKHVYAVKL
ncbi:hypothetical protein [Pseudomonas phage PMBT14]|uniref:Lipoprotein n=1 Tax=Pseudomonas phage PMBT14 TaxID=2059855 RepID=A0A2I6PIA0_9CAUD|nr:hypothetical protein HWB42_gp67 [Pseudomonas phage PMBT14]AUM59785.1 hypothetical protein [Pseudomonas phage PMBT14]